MERRRLSGLVLGVLVGAVLLGTALVAVTSVARLRDSATAAGPVGMEPAFSDIAGSAAAIATPGVPVVSDLGSRTQNFLQSLGSAIDKAFLSSYKLIVKNTLSRFLGELAKNSAEWIASGGRGQKPLFHTQSMDQFLRTTTDAAAAEFLDSLGQSYGIDVCNPKIGAKLVIHYAALPSPKLTNPRCSLQTIQDNWANLLPDNEAFLKKFSVAFEPDQNDLGVALTSSKRLAEVKETKANADLLERLESQGVKPLKDFAGNILTPSEGVKEQIRSTLGLRAQKELAFIGDPVADAIGIFTNTLGSRLQDKWLKKGFVNIADVFSRTGSSALFGGVGRYSIAEPRFAALAELELGDAGAVDVIGELVSCSNPGNPGYGSQCVMDQSFGQAIQQKLTVREAMDRGLLRGEWAFGYQEDGSEPRYGTGYPYSSMVILRTKRVLPVGWELAAQAAKAFVSSVTLEHVVHCFEDPAAAEDGSLPVDCQVPGGINPYYHLVDPNWVLKAPAAYCVRRGASAELLTEQFVCNQDTNGDRVVDCVNVDSGGVDSDVASKDEYYRLLQRASYCADEQSCVAENPDGSCRAYGYCFEEERKFSLGDGQCPGQFASCIGVTTPSGEQTAYIQDSVQTCPTGAAGCQWYSRRQSSSSWSVAPTDRVYLNGEASNCNSNDVGCRRLLRFGQGTNLVPNGGFEQYDRHQVSSSSAPDNFFITTGSAQGQAFTGASLVYEGQASFHLTTGEDISVYAETGSDTAGRTFAASVASRGCAGTLSVLDGEGGSVGSPVSLAGDPNTDWHVTTTTGTTQAPGTALTVVVSGLSGLDCYLDELTLTEGSQPTTLPYGSGRAVHMSSRAVQCTQDDVGCQAFTPVNGDPRVFGRITASDYCPAQCVGYQNFSPLRTVFEEREDLPGPSGANFIPTTARSCSAIDVGCSEFTSLAEVPEGGERVAYFSQIQQCVAEGAANVGTYYTWEGSDTAGYQLRVWQLLRTNLAPDLAPCTNLSLSENPVCEDVSASGLPHSQATCNPALGDPDCREVFDSNANSHFVLWSRVVQSTDDCRQYRRTGGASSVYNVSPRLARRCPAAANGCRQYRGATGGNTRTALLADFETPTAAGWAGGRLALTTEALQVGGHSLMVQGSGAGGTVTLRRTEPVAMRPGHQYMLTVWVKGSERIPASGSTSFRSGLGRLFSRLGVTPASAQPSTVNLSFDGGAATVTGDWQMLQLGPVSTTTLAEAMTFDVTLQLGPGMRSAFFDNVLLKEVTSDTFVVQDSWNTPQACDNPPGLPNGTDAEPRTELGAMVGCSAYRVGTRQVTLRSFNRLCAERNVGCQAFMDTANSSSPFAQRFNATCSLGGPALAPTVCSSGGYQRCVVGVGSASCRYTETFNSSGGTPSSMPLLTGEDQVAVPEDTVAYLVDTPGAYCSPEVAGCSQLGLPRISKQAWSGTGVVPAGGILGWQEAFKVVNPDQFSRTLCTADLLWCAAHRLTGGGTLTFRDPVGAQPGESRACEYRTGVQVGVPPRLVTGWFRTGTDDGCSGLGSYTLPLAGDASYDRFVGVCPAQYSGCTNYGNPQPSATGGQEDNYFLRSSVDASSCNGLVDVAGGCMLFRDPAQPALYSSTYSYPPNRLPGQAPVATSTLDSNVVLKVRRDRSCRQWYSCGTSVAVPGSSTGQRVCTSLSSCTRLDPATNQCADPGNASFLTGTPFAGEYTFLSPDESSKWKNLSGYVVAGIQYGGGPGLVSRGYLPYSRMDQIGESATVSNGGFDDVADSLLLTDGVGWHSCDSGSASVPSSSACTYATAANRVSEGRAALQLATTLNATTTLQHGTVFLAPATTYALSAQVNTTDLLSGSLLIQVLDGAGNTLATISQLAGRAWQQQMVQFTPTGNVSLRISGTFAATGRAYVDEVKIEPVLRVYGTAPDIKLVGQQCRVYPRGDAPSCRYTLADGEYRGITGYCIQADPRDPARCIQWWPVDAVAGQSYDVFGETISLGSRTPLRYCIEAVDSADSSGNYWRQSFDFANSHGDTGGDLTYHTSSSSPDSWEWQIHWSQVAGIKWEWYDGESGRYERDVLFLGELRYWDEHDSQGGVHGFGFYSGQYNNDNFSSLFIGVNPSTGFLESFRGWTDDVSGDGESAHFHTYLILKEQCAVVAEVRRDDMHAAWFERFSNSTPITTADIPINVGDDASPYGALSANVGDNLVNAVCDRDVLNDGSAISLGCALPVGRYPNSLAGEEVERGGTPLSCPSGSCGIPQCSNDRANRCATEPQVEACQAVDPEQPDVVNYCIGRPTAMSTPPPAQPAGNRVQGAQRLSEVFARSYVTWTLDPATRRYVRNDCLSDYDEFGNFTGNLTRTYEAANGVDWDSGCWDRRKLLTSPDPFETSKRPRVNEISVNGMPASTPSIDATVGDSVQIRFTSQLDEDRLPLRYIIVDWGDGTRTTSARMSINHQTTLETGHLYDHPYEADHFGAVPSCPDGIGRCATIRVQIEDNWGFCNGRAAEGSYSILNQTFQQDTAGCTSFDAIDRLRWTSATTTVRFPPDTPD